MADIQIRHRTRPSSGLACRCDKPGWPVPRARSVDGDMVVDHVHICGISPWPGDEGQAVFAAAMRHRSETEGYRWTG